MWFSQERGRFAYVQDDDIDVAVVVDIADAAPRRDCGGRLASANAGQPPNVRERLPPANSYRQLGQPDGVPVPVCKDFHLDEAGPPHDNPFPIADVV